MELSQVTLEGKPEAASSNKSGNHKLKHFEICDIILYLLCSIVIMTIVSRPLMGTGYSPICGYLPLTTHSI